jgi:hypothetical protein
VSDRGRHSGRRSSDGPLLEGLAAGLTVREAATKANVSERTAHRRLADPQFRELVVRTRGEMRSRSVGKLADGSSRAVATLEDLLGAAYPPAIRLGSARAILEHTARMSETVELEERIATLEQAARQSNAEKLRATN